jgi:hypothetical protein
MKESNALLEKRQEAITPFISGNLGEKTLIPCHLLWTEIYTKKKPYSEMQQNQK